MSWPSIVWAVIGTQVHRSICSVTGLALVQVALRLQCHSHTETPGPVVAQERAAVEALTIAAATAMAQEVQGMDQVVEAVVMALVAVERKG